jgi:SAM-dependent methyltransferase
VRPGAHGAVFLPGDAMALPFDSGRFDTAVMALVIFFLPDPAKGVAEMTRVVRPGGLVATYGWDLLGGGFPFDPIREETRAVGIAPLLPQSPGGLADGGASRFVDGRGTSVTRDSRNRAAFELGGGGLPLGDGAGLRVSCVISATPRTF